MEQKYITSHTELELGLFKKDMENFQKFVDKLDIAIDKMQDLIINIQKITALHEQKLLESEKNSQYIWKELHNLTDRIEKLERYKWIFIGAFSLVSLGFQIISTFGIHK